MRTSITVPLIVASVAGLLAGCSGDADSVKAGEYDGRYVASLAESMRKHSDVYKKAAPSDEEYDSALDALESSEQSVYIVLEIDGEKCTIGSSLTGNPGDNAEEQSCSLDYEDKTIKLDAENVDYPIEFKPNDEIFFQFPSGEGMPDLPLDFKKAS